MNNYYPEYYEEFKCIANRCPDSCCQGWDVVVDEKSESYYSSVQGSFGDKIRKVTVTDEDGDRIFTLNNGRCPFWNEDELCDIYINLGEKHLCETCRKFPRISMEFEDFTEHTLSLACPEAARIILDKDFIILNSNYDTNDSLLSFLLNARKDTLKIFNDNSKSFKEQLKEALVYNKAVQNKLSDVNNKANDNKDLGFIFDIHERLEYINPNYSEQIKSARDFSLSEKYEDIFRRLSMYYIYRYYLNALESMDVISVLKRIFCTYIITSALAQKEDNPDIIRIIQRYSKEVEHSYDNNSTLEFFFDNDERFSAENLISLFEL